MCGQCEQEIMLAAGLIPFVVAYWGLIKVKIKHMLNRFKR